MVYLQRHLVVAWLLPRETAAVSTHVLCTPKNHAPYITVSLHSKPHACLAVTCRLHFWQNDRYLLRTAAVTRGWNGYQNKSQHRKLAVDNFSSAAPAGTRTRDLLITSPALCTTELSPFPISIASLQRLCQP